MGALAYAGPRPGEPQAWEERHIRERTILVEQAVRNGRVKVQKTGRAFRAIDLLDLLRADLRFYCDRATPLPKQRLFANNAGEWLSTHDWQNWRRRHFAKAVRSVGLPPMRPYDLRHAFASLLIREQRYSIVEIAEQLGHSGTMTLNVYGHVFAEFRGAPPIAASELLATARREVPGSGPIWAA